jgi:hypothetical protein
MRPPDPNQNPAFAAFLRRSAERLEAIWRTQGVPIPAGVAEQFWRVLFDYMGDHPTPEPNSFYDFSGTRLLEIVQEVQHELPGGDTNAAFAETFARRVRDEMERWEA